MIKPYYETKLGKLYNADCFDILKQMPSNSIDTIITDPPYALEFMNRGWDKVLPSIEIWIECLRVAKPGAMLLSFGGTRTYHRLTCMIEDAGFIIKDCIIYMYGSGFPKSTDISKQLDKGHKRKVVGYKEPFGREGRKTKGKAKFESDGWETDTKVAIKEPATPEAQQWAGWGTALKPAYEPIVIAMKPLDGTYAKNALKHGVAGLNIDGGRVKIADGDDKAWRDGNYTTQGAYFGKSINKPYRKDKPQGRFPANIIHDGSDEVVGLFPNTHSEGGKIRKISSVNNWFGNGGVDKKIYSGSGSAARFFFCAKASQSERNFGLSGNKKKRDESRSHGQAGTDNPYNRGAQKVTNFHPTVKPLSLIRYLCKLTETPTKGIVLDPFLGSGTTAIACEQLNRKWIGVEKEEKYCEIAAKRIDKLQTQDNRIDNPNIEKQGLYPFL